MVWAGGTGPARISHVVSKQTWQSMCFMCILESRDGMGWLVEFGWAEQNIYLMS